MYALACLQEEMRHGKLFLTVVFLDNDFCMQYVGNGICCKSFSNNGLNTI